jgi:predicted nucleic acid-binding protein
MTDFVLDASVALGWLVDDPPSAYALRVQQRMIDGSRPVVPVHWHLEIANALLTAGRRKILRRDISGILSDIAALLPFIETDDLPDDIGTVVGIGQRQQLTAYDASYVALAARRNLSLATQDTAMTSAARRLKIPVLR